MSTELLIEASGIHKKFRIGSTETHVLKGVDVKIFKDDLISIVGASGAGKSTLLHTLGSLDAPTEGTVRFGGRDIYSQGDGEISYLRSRDIGFVFQFHHLLPEFTALENAMLPLMIQGEGRKPARQKALDLLGSLGLGQRVEHLPAELSGGEQQRVAVARALVTCPKILFADEPTGNLDQETGESLVELLFQFHREREMALVLVTHNKSVAEKFQRCIHLEDGRIL